jgi:hypothetical protein
MTLTIQEFKLDSDKLSQIHNKLCQLFIQRLDSGLIDNPKELDCIIRFLDNNSINCTPTSGKEPIDKSELSNILKGMTTQLNEIEAA